MVSCVKKMQFNDATKTKGIHVKAIQRLDVMFVQLNQQ